MRTDKLEHRYDKHAEDFGLLRNKNPEQLQKLEDSVDSHLVDPETRCVLGKYRGHDAYLRYNLRTEIVVVLDGGNEVMTPAYQFALVRLHGALEEVLVGPFMPDYRSLVEEARCKLVTWAEAV